MKKYPVAIIAFEEYDNLGVGYLVSVLDNGGFETVLINFSRSKEDILSNLLNLNPVLVGFSIIFQNYIEIFRELVIYLRSNGINCHFTAGGHFASLKYGKLIEIIPFLDSVVMFEGEYTLLELVSNISSGKDWRKTDGIVYCCQGKIKVNRLRPLEKNLDVLPFPYRPPLKEFVLGKKFATILAGRGCIHNCTFCSTRAFYRKSGGPAKRIRRPEMVAREIELLYQTRSCSVFLFEDDDFPVKCVSDPTWIERFCSELKSSGLDKKIIWKINCRPDEIDEEKFILMKAHGLRLVFVGLEDGTDDGLKRLNKKLTVSQCLNGILILKKLQIGFDFGFMLFQPDTTYSSLHKNIEFLKIICADGYTPVTFLRLTPFYDTLVERELKATGRLKGDLENPGYDFVEDSMNDYFKFVAAGFKDWLISPRGLTNISKWARNYFVIYPGYFRSLTEIKDLQSQFTGIISESNVFFLDTLHEIAHIFKDGDPGKYNDIQLKKYEERIHYKRHNYTEQVLKIINRLNRLSTAYS